MQSPETGITKDSAAILVNGTKDDQNPFVKERQLGGYDVKCIRFIDSAGNSALVLSSVVIPFIL